MDRNVNRILIPQSRIAQRVAELARQITADYAPPGQEAPEITIVPILTGAMIFAADLIRQLPMRMKIGLVTVSSYPGRAIESQGVSILSRHIGEVRDRPVLLVDDILDSGATIRSVSRLLLDMQPASLRTCVLLQKTTPAASRPHADYVGFEIPDEFVVGYGLDYDDYYRNVPDIVTLKRDRFRP